ncbi:MAG: hypothetical protein LBS32_00305 [Clostridiales Family XIII bacterium]|jgi:uroporphyrinogen decarboxylase|nr:hypothetical protein [Clostridiales Family XIII bacterium]
MIDDMRPKERKKAFHAGRDIDRLPTWCFPQDYCSRLTGDKLRDYHLDPSRQVRAILAAHERWELDVVETVFNLGLDLGVKREHLEEDGYPTVVKTIDPSEKEIESWAIEDPRTNPQVRPSWQMLEELQDRLGVPDKAEIALLIPMPFTTAATSIGTDRFLKKLIRDPGYVHLLVGKITDLTVQAISALKGMDVMTWVPDPVASGSMLRLDQYKTFAKPYQARVMKALQEALPHNDHMLHMCGNTTKLWEEMADTGAKAMNIDDSIDFADASRRVGDRVHLMGNIAPMTMLIGSPADIEEDVKRSIRSSARAKTPPIPGFGDSPPLASPVENFDILYAALRKYASCPIDFESLA